MTEPRREVLVLLDPAQAEFALMEIDSIEGARLAQHAGRHLARRGVGRRVPSAPETNPRAARTPVARSVYANAWGLWERWCAARGVPALPGDPLALAGVPLHRIAAQTRHKDISVLLNH